MSKTKSNAPSTSGGAKIIAAFEDFFEGRDAGRQVEDLATVRTVEAIAPPNAYDAAAVRDLRHRLGVSQGVLAQLLAVSRKSVENYEQGISTPPAPVRRLMDYLGERADRVA